MKVKKEFIHIYRDYLILFVLICSMLLPSIYNITTASEKQKLLDDSINANVDGFLKHGIALEYSNPDSAQFYFKKAIRASIEEDCFVGRIISLNRIGYIHYLKGEYDFSLEKYLEAFHLSEVINYQRGIAVGYNNIGLIQNMQNHFDDAITNHEKSIKICLAINDSALISTNYANIGLALYGKKKYHEAISYYDKTIRIRTDQKLYEKLCFVYNLKGEAYIGIQEYDSAMIHFHKVLDQCPTITWEKSFAHAGIAKVFQRIHKPHMSIQHAQLALQYAKQVNSRWDIAEITKILADNYATLENHASAYKYLDLHKKYTDSIFNEKKEAQLNYLRLKSEELKNETLKKENALNQELIEKRNNQLLIALLIAGIILIVSLLILRNYSLKTKLNKKLANTNIQVAQQNKQLSDLNNTKNTLIRVMAHDLKNPISVMISYTDMLLEDFEEFETQEIFEFIQKLNRSSNEGLLLLENLMDWARSQTDSIAIKKTEFDIMELVQINVNLINPKAESKKIALSNEVYTSHTIYADKNMTSAILRNLLSNATKFTPEGGNIHIKGRQIEKKYIISIQDDGVGISEEKLPNIFKLNQEKSTLGTDHEKGSGLGLIICKEFAEKQGGSIHVESTIDHGSIFHLTLPTK